MKKHALLIVDDERENVNLLQNLLGGVYRIFTARDGAKALELLRKNTIHIILTDQRMPGLTGVEFLEQARLIRPDCIRILITAYPDVNDAIEAINRGHVQRYFAKPFDGADLRGAIAQEVERLELVSANKRLNDELGRLVDELFRANRDLRDLNQMKDQFLANCSHELKTPLVSGMGYLDLMLTGGMGRIDERQEKGMRIAHRNLERLLGLIENLLALAKARFRPETLHKSRFSLKPLIEECVESLKIRARKKSLQVRMKWPARALWVEGDERKIHSVLTNVLSNAEKFTPEEAEVDIEVSGFRKGLIRVVVSDNGRGPEDPGGGIQPFKTSTDPRFGGMGIGLTLAREILKAHGGRISLQRGRKGGARVEFELPAAGRARKG